MLKILRKKGVAKKILWIIAVVIILSFGFFGTAYLLNSGGRVNFAGEIFGMEIPVDDFYRTYADTQIQAIIRYGDEFKNVRPYLDLKAETWDRLLLLHEARRRKIAAEDKDVVEAIRQFPFFQRDGRFDNFLYNDILKFVLHAQPVDFERGIRDNVVISKLYQQETSDLTVTDREIFDAYTKKNEKVQVSYILFSPEQFTENVALPDEEIRAYYDQHKYEFIVPPSVNVDYLELAFSEPPASPPGKNPEEDDTIDPEKILEYETSKDAVREKAQTMHQELLANPLMAESAEKFGAQVQTTGFFSMEQPNLALGWPLDLLNTIFQMNVGQITEPFETDQGIVIVKIKEKKEAYIPEFDEIRDKVKNSLARKKARAVAAQKANEHLENITEKFEKPRPPEFSDLAKSMKLELRQTPEFSRGQYLPELGIAKEFQEAAFKLSEDSPLSTVVETAIGTCILHLDHYVPVDQSAFEQEKEPFAHLLLNEKKVKAFNDFLTQLRLEANLVDNLGDKE